MSIHHPVVSYEGEEYPFPSGIGNNAQVCFKVSNYNLGEGEDRREGCVGVGAQNGVPGSFNDKTDLGSVRVEPGSTMTVYMQWPSVIGSTTLAKDNEFVEGEKINDSALLQGNSFEVFKTTGMDNGWADVHIRPVVLSDLLAPELPKPTAQPVVLSSPGKSLDIESLSPATVTLSTTPTIRYSPDIYGVSGAREVRVYPPDGCELIYSTNHEAAGFFEDSTDPAANKPLFYPSTPGTTISASLPLPYSSGGDDNQTCAGAYRIVAREAFRITIGSTSWISNIIKTSETTVQVTAPNDLVKLEVYYKDPEGNDILSATTVGGYASFALVSPSGITDWSVGEISQLSGIPSTVGDPWVISQIYPGIYNIGFPLVAGYTNEYKVTTSEGAYNPTTGTYDPPQTVTRELELFREGVDLTSSPDPIIITLCPTSAGPDECVPSTNLEEVTDLNPITDDASTPGEGDGTLEEEGFCAQQGFDAFSSFSVAWFSRPAYGIICNMALGVEQLMLPLLDVNIPLVTQEDGNTIIKVRLMGVSETGVEAPLLGRLETPVIVYSLWSASTNIANTFVVLGLVFFGMMMIFRINSQSYTLRAVASNLMFKVILANMSYSIMVFLFDFFKILALLTKDTLTGFTGEVGPAPGGDVADPSIGFQEAALWAPISYFVIKAFGALGGLIGVPGAGVASGLTGIPGALGINIGALTAGCLLSVAGTLLATIAVVIVALLMRALYLYTSVIIAPIVFTLSVIPEFKGMFKSWWTSYIKLLAIYPLAYLVYYLLMAVGNVL